MVSSILHGITGELLSSIGVGEEPSSASVADLSSFGTILIDTEDLIARSTLTGDLVESIATDGSLGLTLSKFNDDSRPELLTSVSGVLNNRPVLVQHSQAKLQGSVALRDRPAVWFAVVQRILYNKISIGASVGTGVQITLEDPLETKVWAGQQIEIVASDAAGSLRVGRFTYSNDYERGETVVVGDLIDGDVTSSHYFSTRNSIGERIMRTDGSNKDYMLDSSSGGQQPTNRRFQAFDENNERANDTSNDSVEGAFILLMQYASAADGGVIVRVNGVEEDQQTNTASTAQIGGTFSIGGKVTGVRGVARCYIGRCGWFDGKLDTEGGTVQASAIEAALAQEFGITLP